MLYVVLCIFERPAWRINPSWGDRGGAGYEYSYCQNPEGTTVTDDMFKLPGIATNILFSICLVIMIIFTFMREKFVKASEGDVQSRNIQVLLMTLSIINYATAAIFS